MTPDHDFSDWTSAPQRPAFPRRPPSSAAARPATRAGRPFVHITQSRPDPVLPRGGRRPSRRGALGERLGRPRPVPAWARPLLVALFAAGTGVAFGAVTVAGDGPGLADPLAARPHVTDEQAGLRYGIPDEWKEYPEDAGFGGLPPPFSSGVTSTFEGPEGAAVMVTSTMDDGDLQDIAADQLELVLALNVGTDDADTDEGDPTWVDGRQAAVSTTTLDTPGGSGAAYRCMAFAGESGRTVIVVSVLTEDAGTQYQADLAAVLASMRVI